VVWEPGAEEVEILRVTHRGRGRLRSTLTTFLTFSEFEAVKGKVVEVVLTELIALVEQIPQAVEAKAIESGLFAP
jgi:hypothetical protein